MVWRKDYLLYYSAMPFCILSKHTRVHSRTHHLHKSEDISLSFPFVVGIFLHIGVLLPTSAFPQDPPVLVAHCPRTRPRKHTRVVLADAWRALTPGLEETSSGPHLAPLLASRQALPNSAPVEMDPASAPLGSEAQHLAVICLNLTNCNINS